MIGRGADLDGDGRIIVRVLGSGHAQGSQGRGQERPGAPPGSRVLRHFRILLTPAKGLAGGGEAREGPGAGRAPKGFAGLRIPTKGEAPVEPRPYVTCDSAGPRLLRGAVVPVRVPGEQVRARAVEDVLGIYRAHREEI